MHASINIRPIFERVCKEVHYTWKQHFVETWQHGFLLPIAMWLELSNGGKETPMRFLKRCLISSFKGGNKIHINMWTWWRMRNSLNIEEVSVYICHILWGIYLWKFSNFAHLGRFWYNLECFRKSLNMYTVSMKHCVGNFFRLEGVPLSHPYNSHPYIK